ncbi:MAG: 1-deoxy-D-xylulose 5-phosphate reductoisomerase [Actinomycetota bacterium]
MTRTRVAIAGSTGSIGTQTIDVVLAEPDHFVVTALAAGSSVETLIEQAKLLQPELVVVASEAARARVSSALPGVQVTADLADVVDVADVVINGVVGFAGLPVTMETLRRGKVLGLANKESLIAAGPVVQPLRATPGAVLVPVDSEHCAVHQSMRSTVDAGREVARIVLTASGGPFRGRTQESLASVTRDEALAHPTWKMGPKITVDSSTLMNKGLEVIEAHELFGTPYAHIDVVVHPQSVVHSMVEYTDGSTVAQLSMPDMRLPIGYALGWPNRIATPYGRIDWSTLERLEFQAPDRSTFRCLDLAYDAGRRGGTAPAALSAANEVVVEAFLDGRINWLQIADKVEAAVNRFAPTAPRDLDDVLAADAEGRRLAREVLAS